MANGNINLEIQSELDNDYIGQSSGGMQFTQKYFRNQATMTAAPHSENKNGWSGRWWKIGTGMTNVGKNGCYLNATLQALFHVPAFAKWLHSLTESLHTDKCMDVHCLICTVRSTFIHCQRSRFAITPYGIQFDLHLLGKQFQADKKFNAFEFLQRLLHSLHSCYVDRYKVQNLGSFIKKKRNYTSPIKQIFEGQIRTFRKCERCNTFSFRDSTFKYLVAEVDYFVCLGEVLEYYFDKRLVKCFCNKCDRQVTVTKQRFILKEPSVLCIVIDRFSASDVKCNEFLSFEQTISMRQYILTRKYRSPHLYRFRSSVNHDGPSIEDGHYRAVAVDDLQNFHEFADEKVSAISRCQALDQCICVLFYEKDNVVLEEPY